MLVSIVVPNLNSRRVGDTIASVKQQVWPAGAFEIVVVGRDEPGLVHQDEVVRFLRTDRPVSPARARNLGAKAGRGEWIVFIDADCEARPGWLAALQAAHEAGADFVGGAVEFDADNFWTLCDNVSSFHEYGPGLAPGPRLYLPSISLSVRRTVFEDLGGFDERYPRPAGEDIHLSLRAVARGHRLWFAPEARVCHRPERASFGAVLAHAYTFGFYSIGVRLRYADWYRTPFALKQPWLIAPMSPLLAAVTVARLFIRNPQARRYWPTAPVIFLAKMAWCLGASRGRRRPTTDDRRPTTDDRRGTGDEERGTVDSTQGTRDEPAVVGRPSSVVGRRSSVVHAIVLSWNGRDDTLACLRSVRAMARPPEGVLLVDNASQDDTVAAVRSALPEVEVLESGRNLGYAGGMNLGLERAWAKGAEYVLLLNNDLVVAPGLLDALLAAARAWPQAGILGPTIFHLEEPTRVWHAGAFRSRLTFAARERGASGAATPNPAAVDYVYGAVMLIRRDCLESVGAFDPAYYMYYEDVDLCLRAARVGWQVVHVPAALAWHRVGAGTASAPGQRRRYRALSRAQLFAKHARGPQRLFLLGYTLASAGWNVAGDLLGGRAEATLPLLEGAASGLRIQLAALRAGR